MKRLLNVRKLCLWTVLGASSLALTIGTTCPVTGDNTRPVVPPGNRPPRIIITSVTTPFGNNFAEVGESVSIAFSGEDAEDAAVARVFASTSGNPTPAQEIPILGGFPIGPGSGNGVAVWNTTGFAPGAYNLFAEIDDRTLDPFTGTGNPPVRVTFSPLLQLGAVGSKPPTSPPQLVFLAPVANLGLSATDELTLRYIFADVDSTATVTLLLDKDLNPNNDDIANPGDPNDPASKIIILPSAPRQPTDPVFDGDVQNDPMMPIVQPDSLEIRQNPRTLPQTTPGLLPFPNAPLAGEQKDYIFKIDFSQIPPRTQPYFIRATIIDVSGNTRHVYAVGNLNIAASASGTVDMAALGSGVSGARFRGFRPFENLGSDFIALSDLDMDGVDDFMIAARYASPRSRTLAGAAYLLYGRRKTPFPADTDNDGLPDGGVLDEDGEIVDFPEPPEYLTNPYDPTLVGRFGGQISIEAVGGNSLSFLRGTIYLMPNANSPFAILPNPVPMPPPLQDPSVPTLLHGGLTSITRLDMSGDGIRDLVFGLPYISGALEYHDDDPADGCGELGLPYSGNSSMDDDINNMRCDGADGGGPTNDDMFSLRPGTGINIPHMGLVIMADGANNTRETFPNFIDAGIAGQFDPGFVVDDDDIIRGPDDTPEGCRFRGGWYDSTFDPNIYVSYSEFGRTVSAVPSLDNDPNEELIVSMPGLAGETGALRVWLSADFTIDGLYSDRVRSLPSFTTGACGGFAPGSCQDLPGMGDEQACIRCYIPQPVSFLITGAQPGDRLGYARAAGDVNLDSNDDIVAGAPGADRGGLTNNGIVYVIFTGGPGISSRPIEDPFLPTLQIWGTHDFDGFGTTQTGVQSMNGDNVNDTAIGGEGYDDAVFGADAGFVGVIFGRDDVIGVSTVDQIATPILPGVVFIGVGPGARAGASVSSAGDFNGDGTGDLLVTSPGETRVVNGVTRYGVAYLIFGGPHLTNQRFNLSQVGSAALPGIVFISRVLQSAGPGTEEARMEIAGLAGDVDGDGFDDILLGAPKADFVNTLNPSQRLIDAGEVYLIYGNNFGTNSFVIP